jgi:hypothetical protein
VGLRGSSEAIPEQRSNYRVPDVEDGTDVWMVESQGCTRLAVESLAHRLIRQSIGQYFDRNIPPESSVASLVHFAHPTRAEGRQDFVGSEFVAGRERRL